MLQVSHFLFSSKKRMTFDDLTSRGWSFSNQAMCEACGEDVEWWKNPGGMSCKLVPMNRGSDPVLYHNPQCSDR
jgi:hypothetical protein